MPDVGHTPTLRAEGVRKQYGAEPVLDGVSLRVERGECLALVGESGAGKSTLLRCFNRLVEPDAGTVWVDGRDVRALDAVALRRRVGYVPQEGGLLPHWTVHRNVTLVPWLRDMPDAGTLADIALERVGLAPGSFGTRHPGQLSGGQRQRVALARAVAAGPAVVLLDEPFGALDALTRADMQTLFLALRRELRLTAVLVTHDLHEAALLADHIAVLRDGAVEQMAPPAELLAAPATPYVADLLARARIRPDDIP